MSQKTVITSALILTTASFITKIMGFFYRIFMSSTIGAEGMGLYQLIMPIYSLAWSITSAGFTTTISHLTAQENSKGNFGNIHLIVKQSLFFSFLLSMAISCFLFFQADFLASTLLKEPRIALSFRWLALAVPFMTAGSCLRGYFLGMQTPLIPAISQVLEQAIRIIAIYLLAGSFLSQGLELACVATIIGIILGEFLSFLFVLSYYKPFKQKNNILIAHNKPTLSHLQISKLIFHMALPLGLTRIFGSLLSAIEHILIPQKLQQYGENTSNALEIYGELTGMAMPLIFLPSACLMAVSVSLIPEISKSSAIGQSNKIHKTVSATFLFTFILGIGSATIFAVFPQEICYIVYNRPNLGELLFPLAFICPFLYAQITLHGLLNGLGEQIFLFVNHLISSAITIIGIIFFMPLYGIDAFLWSMFFSLLISLCLALYRLYQKTNAVPNIKNCFIRPLMAGLASGLIVRYVIQIGSPSKIFFVCALIGVSILYLFFLYALGCFSDNELSQLFKRKQKQM